MIFSNVLGHEEVLSRLSSGLENRTVTGTYLFTGPSSVGKATIAQALSRYLLCIGTMDDTCRCESCRLFPESPDYMKIQGTSIIKTSDISEVDDFLSLYPYLSKKRVVLIDDAHRLNYSAATRLLKITEELNKNNIIIMVSSKPDRILDTLRSRSYNFQFGSLQPKDTLTLLKKLGHKISDIKKIEDMIPYLSGDLLKDYGEYREIIKEMPGHLKKFLAKDSDDILSIIDGYDSRGSLEAFIDIYILHLNDLIKIHYGASAQIFNINNLEVLQQLAVNWKDEICLASLSKIIPGLKQYRRGLNLRLRELVLPGFLFTYFFIQKGRKKDETIQTSN